ncbi:Uncharacterised protein [Pseudomonas putida]|nr:Uncharacterised protein [Pseudomonas putida]CAB5676117.1 Uncharacterised protein [Pseudomonas putida]CAB5699122.1 Uncharacterised protein [Pseudomonas putida]CAC9681481.1 Uncharacterised protein [Pseudomonas putida]CAC9692662.1 Uncharacterised protein [Pseudomonas putida]
MKDDGFEPKFLNKSRSFILCAFIVAMDDENSLPFARGLQGSRRRIFQQSFFVTNCAFNEIICYILGPANCLLLIGWATNNCYGGSLMLKPDLSDKRLNCFFTFRYGYSFQVFWLHSFSINDNGQALLVRFNKS